MGKKIKGFVLLAVFAILLLLPMGIVQAGQERIIEYDSLLEIQNDASLIVTESIQVLSTGEEIRRGIFRDFPTIYTSSKGNRVRVYFSLLSVLRDGTPEPHTTESLANGIRIRIGSKNIILPPGQYTYTIKYKVSRALGFFDGYDELYWNVTGSGWTFPIDSASATVVLPPGAPVDSSESTAYTGYDGETGSDFVGMKTASGVKFFTTRAFAAGEGLTVVVNWPKGHVIEPNSREKFLWFLLDNIGVSIGFLTLLLPLFWYLYAWFKVGRDPAKGVIYPRYTPPEGLSPAAIRYVRRMGYDNKTYTAAIINLAVRGSLTIFQEKKTKTALMKTDAEIRGFPEEDAVREKLFRGTDYIELKDTNHGVLGSASSTLDKLLSKDHEGKHFKTNSSWLILGILLNFALLVGTIYFSARQESLWGIALFYIATIEAVVLIVIFGKLLKAPTLAGRALMDEIEGFKMFLEVAEADYLQWSAPPERTPELFEEYLPYALALDVPQQWANKFSNVLAAASAERKGYSPSWYHGPYVTSFSATNFANTLSTSFNSTIASAKTAPGSSSGSSGGSSGGGGGGGGGGGW